MAGWPQMPAPRPVRIGEERVLTPSDFVQEGGKGGSVQQDYDNDEQRSGLSA